MFLVNLQKKLTKISPIEPILLFMVFFLPGFLHQNVGTNPDIFNSLSFNFFYLITVLPQIFLLLYMIGKKGNNAFTRYGITALTGKDIRRGIFYFVEVLILMTGVGIAFYFASNIFGLKMSSIPRWTIENPQILPIVFITCLTTGYSEELFFRSYLLTEFISVNKDRVPVALAASLLFASGHLYEGIGGFISTFIIGIFFSLLFIKNKRLHPLAIGHSLYNFSVLLMSIFFSVSP